MLWAKTGLYFSMNIHKDLNIKHICNIRDLLPLYVLARVDRVAFKAQFKVLKRIVKIPLTTCWQFISQRRDI
jgi:hypothetical protein